MSTALRVGHGAKNAAPVGVADGSAPPDERSPLINGQSRSPPPGYDSVPRPEEVDGMLRENRHFNLAGLAPSRFWILVRYCYMVSRWLTNDRCLRIGFVAFWSLSMVLWVSPHTDERWRGH